MFLIISKKFLLIQLLGDGHQGKYKICVQTGKWAYNAPRMLLAGSDA
jgi:hypothetical protein